MLSSYLNARQLQGLSKMGEILIPGGDDFPSFTQCGCIEHVDRILEYMPEKDLADLRTLMAVFAFLPAFMIRAIMAIVFRSKLFPGPIGSTLRFMELGLKGVVMTLYYSGLQGSSYQGKNLHDLIGWDARILSSTENADLPEGIGRFRKQH